MSFWAKKSTIIISNNCAGDSNEKFAAHILLMYFKNHTFWINHFHFFIYNFRWWKSCRCHYFRQCVCCYSMSRMKWRMKKWYRQLELVILLSLSSKIFIEVVFISHTQGAFQYLEGWKFWALPGQCFASRDINCFNALIELRWRSK